MIAGNTNELSEDNSKEPGNVTSLPSAEDNSIEPGNATSLLQDEENLTNQQHGDEEAISHIKNSNEDASKNLTSETLHKLPKAYTTGNTQPASKIGMLKLKLERFADNVSSKLADLFDEMRSIKESKAYSIIVLEGVINELKNDKAELCKDKELLKNENIDMLHTIANLNTKLNALENEKASLPTIIRLLQSEPTENNTNYSQSTYQKIPYNKANTNYCDAATKLKFKESSKAQDVATANKFSVFEAEEIDDDNDSRVISSASDNDCSVYESKRSERNKHKSKQPLTQTAYQKQHQQSSEKKPKQKTVLVVKMVKITTIKTKQNVELCGDSMTKHLQAHKIGRSKNERVVSKSLSGATCKDMKHYIVPMLEKKPDELYTWVQMI